MISDSSVWAETESRSFELNYRANAPSLSRLHLYCFSDRHKCGPGAEQLHRSTGQHVQHGLS